MSDTSAVRRTRKTKEPMPARSVRVADETWDRAKNRAAYEGTTISNVIVLILEGYSKGLLNLPTVTVQYQQPEKEAASTPTE